MAAFSANGWACDFAKQGGAALGAITCSGVAAAQSFSGLNTALAIDFLTFATPFVTSGSSAQPNALDSGVWVRGIGGNNKVSSSFSASGAATVRGSDTVSTSFGGLQGGFDSGPLNIGGSGWNLHIGLTAGLALATSTDAGDAVNGKATDPFLGGYVVATKDNFFANLQVRGSRTTANFNLDLSEFNNDPGGSTPLSAQLKASAWDVSGATGYRITFGSVFVEPNAGFDIATTKVNPIDAAVAGAGGKLLYAGSLQIENFDTSLGFIGARFGTGFTVSSLALQPYVAANLWRQFSGDINVQAVCAGGAVCPAGGSLDGRFSRIGTFGQLGLGVAGQVLKTGLVGYVRGDLRDGNDYRAASITGGLRYSF